MFPGMMRGSEGLLLSCQKNPNVKKRRLKWCERCEEEKKKGKKISNLVTSEPGFVKKKSISASLVVGC